MRVLFTFAGGSGHADPLVHIADAVRAAGHTVAFAGRRSGTAVAEARGFPLLDSPTGLREDDGTITSLLELDMGREFRVLRDFYCGREARSRVTRILELTDEWSPDLLVCDEVDFGAMIAAEQLGLPHVTCLVTASGSFVTPQVVLEPLNDLRAEHDLPPDADMAMSYRHLVVSPFPPSFRDPAYPAPPNTLSVRPEVVADHAVESLPSWLPRLERRTAVYFTLGTVFNTESGDLFERVLTGLRDLPVEVVVTIGRDLDPDAFGPQPENVHIARYVPQSILLRSCDAVVNHGGSGSVIGALAHGLPIVVMPLGADQSLNAARCEQLGVGIVLDAFRSTSRSVRESVEHVLDSPHYRLRAERVRDEIASLPGVETAVPLLEQLGGE